MWTTSPTIRLQLRDVLEVLLCRSNTSSLGMTASYDRWDSNLSFLVLCLPHCIWVFRDLLLPDSEPCQTTPGRAAGKSLAHLLWLLKLWNNKEHHRYNYSTIGIIRKELNRSREGIRATRILRDEYSEPSRMFWSQTKSQALIWDQLEFEPSEFWAMVPRAKRDTGSAPSQTVLSCNIPSQAECSGLRQRAKLWHETSLNSSQANSERWHLEPSEVPGVHRVKR